MFEIYPILKFVHVAAVICWVGGGLMLSILAEQIRRDGTPEEIAGIITRMDWFGPRFFSPLAVVTLLAGIGLTQIGWSFQQPWVGIGVLGLLVSGAISGMYLTRRGRQLQELIASKGAGSAEVDAAFGRLLMAARINVILLFLVVVDMVIKPGG